MWKEYINQAKREKADEGSSDRVKDSTPLLSESLLVREKVGFSHLVFKTLGTLINPPSHKVPAAEVLFSNGYGLTVQKFASKEGKEEFFCQIIKLVGEKCVPLHEQRYYPPYRKGRDFTHNLGDYTLVERILEKVQSFGGEGL